MASLLDSASRHAQAVGLERSAIVALIVLAVIIAAGVAFGWTASTPPSFDIVPDPAGQLPF